MCQWPEFCRKNGKSMTCAYILKLRLWVLTRIAGKMPTPPMVNLQKKIYLVLSLWVFCGGKLFFCLGISWKNFFSLFLRNPIQNSQHIHRLCNDGKCLGFPAVSFVCDRPDINLGTGLLQTVPCLAYVGIHGQDVLLLLLFPASNMSCIAGILIASLFWVSANCLTCTSWCWSFVWPTVDRHHAFHNSLSCMLWVLCSPKKNKPYFLGDLEFYFGL